LVVPKAWCGGLIPKEHRPGKKGLGVEKKRAKTKRNAVGDGAVGIGKGKS